VRVLLWAAVIFAVAIFLLHLKKTVIQRHRRDRANPQNSSEAGETMVQCAQCGVHIPASEAVLARSNLAFCSEEHRLKHCAD